MLRIVRRSPVSRVLWSSLASGSDVPRATSVMALISAGMPAAVSADSGELPLSRGISPLGNKHGLGSNPTISKVVAP